VESFQFKESTFFVFILPPIIFAAGYNLKKTNFVKNFGYITLFGVLGTLISFGVLSFLILFWNELLHE
jgi:NhaP-type Na+/H+ or K+/H+ antiporter